MEEHGKVVITLLDLLQEAGLPSDPRSVIGGTFLLVDKEDPSVIVGRINGIQMVNDTILLLTDPMEVVLPDFEEICALHYLFYDREDHKWVGEVDNNDYDWAPSGVLSVVGPT